MAGAAVAKNDFSLSPLMPKSGRTVIGVTPLNSLRRTSYLPKCGSARVNLFLAMSLTKVRRVWFASVRSLAAISPLIVARSAVSL